MKTINNEKLYNRVKKVAKAGFYIIAIICIGLSIVLVQAPRTTSETQTRLDSLNTANLNLQRNQQKYDSILVLETNLLTELDLKLSKIKTQTTVIREYYHEQIKSVDSYGVIQVEEYLKNRYKY